MKELIREYLRKLALRPLMIPAVILVAFMCVFGGSLIKTTDRTEGEYEVLITVVISGASGKNTYYGIIDDIGKVRIMYDEELNPGDRCLKQKSHPIPANTIIRIIFFEKESDIS